MNTWGMLSEDGRAKLKSLLPPTAFSNYRETLGEDHPAFEDMASKGGSSSTGEDSNAMVVDSQPEPELPQETTQGQPDPVPKPESELNLSVFTDPHFLAAARTFQDHLYLGWFTEAHVQKVRRFQAGVVSGDMAAPWKDEVWERDNVALVPVEPDVESVNSAKAGCVYFVLFFVVHQANFYSKL